MRTDSLPTSTSLERLHNSNLSDSTNDITNETIKDDEIEMSMEREGKTMRLDTSIIRDILQVRSNWLCRNRLIELECRVG